jgi:hypothetical protein
MTRKRQTVRVGNIDVTPITAEEHRELDRKINKRYERLRKTGIVLAELRQALLRR